MQICKKSQITYPIGILWNMGQEYAREMMLKIAIMDDVIQVRIMDLQDMYEQFVYDCYSEDEEALEGGYIYVDKTKYIQKLEELSEKRIMFLRPRKFGKTLFTSVLENYYDIHKKDKFKI